MSPRPTDRDLADFLFVLWSRRFLILIFTGLAAVLALVVSLSLPKSYRATATLMIAGSKVPTGTVGETTRPPDSRIYADTYAELVRSRANAARVVRDLQLDQSPDHLNEEALSQSLQIRAIPGTLLLTVSLNMRDPDLAARVVNAETIQAVELSRTLSTNELTDTRKYLQAQVASGKSDLDRKQEALRELKATLRYEESSEQLEYLLRQRGQLESALNTAGQSAAQAEAEVKAYDKALQGQSRTVILSRTLVDDPAFSNAAQAATGRDAKTLLGLQMKSEELNPVVTRSEPERVRAAARAAGFSARRDALRKQLTDSQTAIRTLERELANKQATLDDAQQQFDLAKSAYENFATNYESARLSVAATAAELKIVDPAVPSRQPVGPRTALNIVIASVTSFVLIVFTLLLMDHLRTAQPTSQASASAALRPPMQRSAPPGDDRSREA